MFYWLNQNNGLSPFHFHWCRWKTISGCLCLGLAGLGLSSLTESIAEAATDNLQVAASSGSSSLSALSLHWPVVYNSRWAWEREADSGCWQTYMNESLPLDIRTASKSTFECGKKSGHNDGRSCGSYYGAFQSWMYPLSVKINKIAFEIYALEESCAVNSPFRQTFICNEISRRRRKMLVSVIAQSKWSQNYWWIYVKL